jgi:hypothetical protein
MHTVPMTTAQQSLKYRVGQWVEVTVKREGVPLVLIGKVTEATRDFAIATCRTSTGDQRFTYSDDTEGFIVFDDRCRTP